MSRQIRALGRTVARGYTIVELLMSLSVLAIGVSGVIAMQKVTISSNRHAKELAVATRIAEAWADQLAMDGMLWTTSQGRSNTEWLKLADPAKTIEWFPPAHSTTRGFGSAFDALGAPVNATVAPQLAHFCAHIRFAYLHSDTAPTAGNGVIRAQVRVFWRREDNSTSLPTTTDGNLCATEDTIFSGNLDSFQVVYLTTAVAQSPQGLL
jgi:type IV pilus assembly protein PilV